MQIRIQRRELALKVDSNVFIRVYISTLLGSLKTGATVALNYRKTHKEASNQLCLTQQAQHRHGSAAEPRSLGRDLRGRSVASSGRRAARPAARRALSTGNLKTTHHCGLVPASGTRHLLREFHFCVRCTPPHQAPLPGTPQRGSVHRAAPAPTRAPTGREEASNDGPDK